MFLTGYPRGLSRCLCFKIRRLNDHIVELANDNIGHPIFYVIGDIHGEVDRLVALHTKINNYHLNVFSTHRKIIIHLGDYVDRGHDSYAVIEWIMERSELMDAQSEIINLKGNHEDMMVKAFLSDNPSSYNFWIKNGGVQTIESYAWRDLSRPPKTHLDWMQHLKSYYWNKKEKIICVHAGIDQNTFPNDGQTIHLWKRTDHLQHMINPVREDLKDTIIIHGHTPTETCQPDISTNRLVVNVDTGACFDGDLTSAIVRHGELLGFLST